MQWDDTRWRSNWNPDWHPPPPPPLALALTNNSEVGLREVSAYLNLPSNRDLVNSTIYHRGYDYYFVDGGRDGRFTLPIFWAMDSHYFMQEWAIRRLAILFDHGAEVNVLHECRQVTPLYFVMIRLRNWAIAKFLVENGADPNFKADICPILCDYIRKNCWESQANTVRFLLEIGTDPNQYDNMGWTPLIVAIHCGDEETVHTLLEHGADPLLQSRTEGNRKIVFPGDPYFDMSALEVSCCAITSSTSLLEKILPYIPAHKYTTENLQRPLYFACAYGHLSSVELIMVTIPPEEFKSHILQGALYIACNYEEVDVIMRLVKQIFA